MKRKESIFIGAILLFITLLFFHKFFFFHLIPFPGDLLTHDYSPWKYYTYLGYNPGSYPTKLQYFDVIRQLYPWKLMVIESLKNGQIPLWNPYNFAGSPLLANLQSQVFTPFNLLYFLLPAVYGWSISLFLQIILAFFFTYLYARRIEIGGEGAILSAVAFSCSLYMATFFQYGVFGMTILWLPLILFGIEGIVSRFSLKDFFFVVVGIVFSAFGGHVQVFSYVVFFAFAYAIFRLFFIKKYLLKLSGWLFLAFVLAIGIASVQLLPSLELIQLSARASYETNFFLHYFLLKPQELILLFSPDFYGNPTTNNFLLDKSYPQTALYIGMIPLAFALSVIFLKKNTTLKFFLTAAIITFIGVTNNPFSNLFYSLQLPFISASAPTNAIFLIAFSLSILAGYGLDQWIQKKNKFVFFVSLFLGALVAGLYLFHQVSHTAFSNKNALYTIFLIGVVFVILSATRFLQQRKIFALILIAVTIFDLFYFFQKFNPFVPSELVFPDAKILNVIQEKAGIERVWGYGNANISPNTNTLFSFSSPDGYDPLYPRHYGKFIYASRDGKLLQTFDPHTRSDAVIQSELSFFPGNPYALKILSVLGVQYVLDRVENGSTEKVFPSDTFKPIYDQDGWKIFENIQAAPRVFLTSEYAVYNSDQEFERLFFADDFDPSQTVLLEKGPSLAKSEGQRVPVRQAQGEKGKVEVVSYEPNNVEISVATNQPALLFLSDMYYPGWKAYIDGNETEIMRANYTFRAVTVPEGKHRVEFIYQPQSFLIGGIITFVSVTILFVVSLLLRVRK